MEKLTIIGDVHGKVERYKEIITNCEFRICVGDFGFEKECEKYRIGERSEKPRWYYYSDGLHF